ncbi:MAG: molybdopterin molybdotransferase, partial [Glaciecola sp.]
MAQIVTDGPTFGFQGLGRAEVVTASELTPVDDYLAFLLDQVPRLGEIRMQSADALGLVLAADLEAQEPLPAFANSAMDGYAVVSADVAAATLEEPITLRVLGEVAAGAAELTVVQSGGAVRIMTGAPLPPGADAVVPVEQTSGSGNRVQIHVPTQPGKNVRRVGEDVQPGQRLLAAGRRIGAADIALMAATGHAHIEVYPAPRVVVVSTGDELVSAEQ